MIYFKEAILKNGKKCILRSPSSTEALEIIEHMRITSDETDNMLRYPDEITVTEAQQAEHIENIISSDNSIMISAIVDNKIVGNAELRPVFTLDKGKHRAEFGISIQQHFCNYGIGTHLVSALLETARIIGYEQVELDVVCDNAPAIALYTKLGFTIFGTNNKAYKRRSGDYQAMHLMLCEL